MTIFRLSILVFFLSFFLFRYARQRTIFPRQPHPVIIEGTVAENPYVRGQSQYMEVRSIEIKKATVPLRISRVLVRSRLSPEVSFGCQVRLEGDLSPYGTLNFPKVEIISSPRRGLRVFFMDIRKGLEVKISSFLPQEEAGLLIGILLGSPSGIPFSLESTYKKAGLTHVVVASGYNMTVLSGFLLAVTSPFSLHLSVFLSVVGLFFYALLLGFSPPVLRAFLMVTLTMLGLLLGRKKDSLRVLIACGIFMIFLNPGLLNSISFQLSFMATLGLVVLALPLEKTLTSIFKSIKLKVIRGADSSAGSPSNDLISYVVAFFSYVFEILQIGENTSSTISASVFVFPILSFYFGEFSLISFVANTVLLWLTPPGMLIGVASVLAIPFSGVFSKVLAWCAWPFLKAFNLGAKFFSLLPLTIKFRFSSASVLVYYFFLLLVCATFWNFWGKKKNGEG